MKMMKKAKKLTNSFVDSAGDVAKRVSCMSRDVADTIGPKRGLIGLAVIGVAIGGSVLAARFLRARRAENIDVEVTTEDLGVESKGRKRSRRRNNVAHVGAH